MQNIAWRRFFEVNGISIIFSREIQKLRKYLPAMKLDGHSFELCQERVDN